MTKKRTKELLDSIFELLPNVNKGELLSVFWSNIQLKEGESDEFVALLEKLVKNEYLSKSPKNQFYILTEKGKTLKKAQIIVRNYNTLFNL